MLWEAALLFPITLNVALSEVQNINPCLHKQRLDLKTWGYTCQTLCRCKNNEDCHVDGFCPSGCEARWRRENPKGPCSILKHVHRLKKQGLSQLSDKIFVRGSPSQKSSIKNRVSRIPRNRLSSRSDVHLYRFAPSETCIRLADGSFERSWEITTPLPLLIHRIQVHFESKPFLTDALTLVLKLSNFTLFSATKKLYPAKIASVLAGTVLELTVADLLILSAINRGQNQNCTLSGITAVLVFGHPVCAYRKWGSHCQKDCPCPCHVAECHPSTGYCWTRGFACPPSKYGPSCSFNCSNSCGGRPQECHMIYATCKSCPNTNHTGRHCERPITKVELQARNRICQRFSLNPKTKIPVAVLQNAFQSTTSKANSTKAIILLVSLILFLFAVGCCVYAQIIRYCARERLRKQRITLDEERRRKTSLMSYSELKKEFFEMQGLKKCPACESTEISPAKSDMSTTDPSDGMGGTSVDANQRKKVKF